MIKTGLKMVENSLEMVEKSGVAGRDGAAFQESFTLLSEVSSLGTVGKREDLPQRNKGTEMVTKVTKKTEGDWNTPDPDCSIYFPVGVIC